MRNFIHKFIFISADVLFLILIFYLSKKLIYVDMSVKEFLFIVFILIISFYNENVYNIRYDFWQEMKKVFKSLIFAYLIVLVFLAFIQKLKYYKFVTIFFLLIFVLLPIYKRVLKKILFKFSVFKEKVKIIGEKNIFKREIKDNWYLGMEEKDNFESIIVFTKNFNEINKIIDKYIHDKKIYIVPILNEINFINSEIIEFHNIRKNVIKVENKLLNKKNIFIKEISDFTLAVLIFPIFLILHMIISLLIKFDSNGSIFYKQKRVGKNGKIFTCYKYRTMYENGDEILKKYLSIHPEEIEYYKKYHKYRNDPRITKIGKFLRSTSLDELPQVINVLKGEMSFVGPRPYLPDEIKNIAYKNFILKVKPGITGLWQVSGRSNLTFTERLELEKWYIKNWSLWEDFIILIKTFKVVILKIGAK